MSETKKAAVKEAAPEVKAPEASDEIKKEMEGLKNIVANLQAEVSKSNPKRSRYTEHVKEHVVMMREYRDLDDDKNKGLVNKIYNVRKKKDPDGVQRYISVCNLEVFNPETDKTFVVEANYLDFLQGSVAVPARIVKTNKKQVISERVGTRYVSGKHDSGQVTETVGENDYLFEVESYEYHYTLEILTGEFKGVVIENDGKGLNI